MKTNNQVLEIQKNLELDSRLEEIKIDDIPLWRLVRFQVRIRFLKRINGFVNNTHDKKLNKFKLLKYFFISFYQFIDFMFFKRGKFKNVFFAFPRLFYVNKKYIDKFSDPIIERAIAEDSYLIFQHSFGNPHLKPRKNNSKIIYSDFIDVVAKVFGFPFRYYFLRKYKNKINSLKCEIDAVYGHNIISKIEISQQIAQTFIYKNFYYNFFKIIKPKNVFIVSREVFKFIIPLKNKFKFTLYELQHGVTQSNTPMYTGEYNEKFDPDFFLTFGSIWVNKYFGMPLDRIKNIGFAYHRLIENIGLSSENIYNDNDVLFISSPAITDSIIQLILELPKSEFKNSKFYIRLHPQESLNKYQKQALDLNGVTVLSNKEDAVFCISKFQNILGDHSSVLYEALAYGKKVGKINMYSMYSRNLEEDIKTGFFIIKEISDLKEMIDNKSYVPKEQGYYTAFDSENFKKLIN